MGRIIPIRVLVLDDDAQACRQVATWLRDDGCDAVAFTAPAEALAQAPLLNAAVALVDLRLTGVNGADVIREMVRLAPRMHIVALAAFPEVRDVLEAVRAGARDVLEKPVQPATLRAAVQRRLDDLRLGIRTEAEFNTRLGARLRTLRQECGRTLADVAGECGLTSAQLSQIELGKSATGLFNLARIGASLGIGLDQLVRGL